MAKTNRENNNLQAEKVEKIYQDPKKVPDDLSSEESESKDVTINFNQDEITVVTKKGETKVFKRSELKKGAVYGEKMDSRGAPVNAKEALVFVNNSAKELNKLKVKLDTLNISARGIEDLEIKFEDLRENLLKQKSTEESISGDLLDDFREILREYSESREIIKETLFEKSAEDESMAVDLELDKIVDDLNKENENNNNELNKNDKSIITAEDKTKTKSDNEAPKRETISGNIIAADARLRAEVDKILKSVPGGAEKDALIKLYKSIKFADKINTEAGRKQGNIKLAEFLENLIAGAEKPGDDGGEKDPIDWKVVNSVLNSIDPGRRGYDRSGQKESGGPQIETEDVQSARFRKGSESLRAELEALNKSDNKNKGAKIREVVKKIKEREGISSNLDIIKNWPIAIHGRAGIDPETGKPAVREIPDLDGRLSLFLAQDIAGNRSDVKYVFPGERAPGRFNIDTSNRWGFVLEDETAAADHHAQGGREKTSAAKIIYDELVKAGEISKEDQKYLGKLTDFITMMDNMDYDVPKDYFKNSHKTILGLAKQLNQKDNFQNLKAFFKDHKDDKADLLSLVTTELSDDDIKKYKFKKVVEKQAEKVKSSENELNRMGKKGLIVNSKDYGRIAIDIGANIHAGYDAARAKGCDTYIIWSPENNSFFISSSKNLDLGKLGLNQGIKVRDNMWVKSASDEEELKTSLNGILLRMGIVKSKMGIRGDKVSSELGAYITQENLSREINSFKDQGKEISEDEKNTITKYINNKLSFINSKYEKDPIMLRKNLLALDNEIVDFNEKFDYKNDKAVFPVHKKLREFQAEASRKINRELIKGAVKQCGAGTSAGFINPDKRDKIVNKILTAHKKNYPMARGLVEKDIDLAIRLLDKKIKNEQAFKGIMEKAVNAAGDIGNKNKEEHIQNIINNIKNLWQADKDLGKPDDKNPYFKHAMAYLNHMIDKKIPSFEENDKDKLKKSDEISDPIESDPEPPDIEPEEQDDDIDNAYVVAEQIDPGTVEQLRDEEEKEDANMDKSAESADKETGMEDAESDAKTFEELAEMKKEADQQAAAAHQEMNAVRIKLKKEGKEDYRKEDEYKAALKKWQTLRDKAQPISDKYEEITENNEKGAMEVDEFEEVEPIQSTKEKKSAFEYINGPEIDKDEKIEEMGQDWLEDVEDNKLTERARNQAQEGLDDIKKMNKKEKKTFLEGLANFGYRTTETKSWILSKFCRGIGKATKNRKLLNTYFNEYANIHEKTGERAKKMRETIGKRGLSKVSGAGQGLGNFFRYGRVVYDVIDRGSLRKLNPFRHVTAAAMFLGRSAEAAKETRFTYDDLIEKTRVKEEDRAMEEAWKIYNSAVKNKRGEKVSAEELERSYKEQLPEDIQERLNRMNLPATKWYKIYLNKSKDVKVYSDRLKKKVDKIKNDKKLSPDEKEQERKILLQRNEALLEDLDRMVGDQGTVDNIAYWSRLTEKVGKGVATALIVDSVARIAKAGSELSYIFSKDYWEYQFGAGSAGTRIGVDKAADMGDFRKEPIIADPTGDSGGEVKPDPEAGLRQAEGGVREDWEASAGGIADQEEPKKALNIDDEFKQKAARQEVLLGVKDKADSMNVSDAYKDRLELGIVRQGDGVTHTIMRQLVGGNIGDDNFTPDPKHLAEYGYNGDPTDKAAIKLWGQKESFAIAQDNGYIDAKGGGEIRLSSKAIDNVAYILDKDGNGEYGVREMVKGPDGEFLTKEAHEPVTEFEGENKESYEYVEEPRAPETAGTLSLEDQGKLDDIRSGLAENAAADQRMAEFNEFAHIHGINEEFAKSAGINLEDGFSSEEREILEWGLQNKYSAQELKSVGELSGATGIDYHEWHFQKAFENMPKSLIGEQAVGYIEANSGRYSKDHEIMSRGFNRLFGAGGGWEKRTDNVFVIKNAFGRKNFSVLFNMEKNKIGIDGWSKSNFGAKGGWFTGMKIKPNLELNPENLAKAEEYTINTANSYKVGTEPITEGDSGAAAGPAEAKEAIGTDGAIKRTAQTSDSASAGEIKDKYYNNNTLSPEDRAEAKKVYDLTRVWRRRK